MKHKKRITAAIMAAVMSCSAMTAVMPALTGTAITASAAASLSISSSQMSLGKGESVKLTANQSVTWRTSAPKILTVDKNGNVKAVGTGTAWITARSKSGSEKSCKITVKKAPTWVGISQSSLTMGVGETFTLSANVASDAGAATRTFRTSNSGIVKMTKTNWTGSFTAVKPGTAWVTVRLYNGLEKSCKITVKKAPTYVSISKKSMTMNVGETATLSASVASDAGCAKRTFRTSNSSIVKMTKTDWTGSFKAVAPGTAWVTVRTYNGKEASCKITVVKDWRTLYCEKLNSVIEKYPNNELLAFELYDVDKDGVPELFISYAPFAMATCELYYVYNGTLKEPGIVGAYGQLDVGDNGLIYAGSRIMGLNDHVYQKQGGTIKSLFYFSTNNNMFGRQSPVYYMINEKEISQREFDSTRNKYLNACKTVVGRKNQLHDRSEYEWIIYNY